jgi:hypothetical protein
VAKNKFAIVIVLALAAGPALAQTCPGDLNHDNQVVISEVIAVVNAALDGCGQQSPTPKPTPMLGCPYTFTDAADIQAGPYCAYDGPFNPGDCRADQGAAWESDGHAFAVAFRTTPVLGLIGVTTGPRSGRITGATGDGFTTIHSWTGTVALGENGQTLTVTPTSPPFWIDEPACTVVHYEGTYVGLVSPSASTSQAAIPLGEPASQIAFPADILERMGTAPPEPADDPEPIGGAASE